MPSVGTHIAQNPSRLFAVTQDQVGAYYFTDADITTWYTANQSNITKVGSVYIVPGLASGTTFADVILGNNGATQLGGGGTTPDIGNRKTLKDMGKELIFGNKIVTRLLVLRRVQSYINSYEGGTLNPNDTVYVVVENNCTDLQANTGRFTVRVARI
jgi:hypothetical protein